MRRSSDAGFSLVEILVVLALIGTMAGLTMLSFSAANRSERPEAEAKLLASRLTMAADDALLTGAEFSLRIDASGYRVEVWSSERRDWTAHPDKLLGSRHTVSAGITMDIAPRLVRLPIRPNAISEGATITFADADDRWRVSHDGLSARASRLEP